MTTERDRILDFIWWWEKKRWIYNLIAGLFGVAGISLLLGDLFILYAAWFLREIIFFGVLANLCFTVGWALPLWNVARTHNIEGLGQHRRALFIIGTAFTVIFELFYILMTALFNHH